MNPLQNPLYDHRSTSSNPLYDSAPGPSSSEPSVPTNPNFIVSLNPQPSAPPAEDIALVPGQHAFRLKIVSASNLKVADIKSSDPYVVMKYNMPQDRRQFTFATNTGGEKKKSRACLHTTVRFNTLNPEWNEVFELRIPGQVENEDCVFLEIWDYDSLGQDDYMGCCMVPLANLGTGDTKQLSLPVLEGTGTVNVEITAINFETGPTDLGDLETRYLEGRRIEAENRARNLEAFRAEAKEKRIKTAKKVGKVSLITVGVIVAIPVVICVGAVLLMAEPSGRHRYRW